MLLILHLILAFLQFLIGSIDLLLQLKYFIVGVVDRLYSFFLLLVQGLLPMKGPKNGEHLLYPRGYFAIEVLLEHGLHFGPGLFNPSVIGDDDAFPGEICLEGGEGL